MTAYKIWLTILFPHMFERVYEILSHIKYMH